MVVMVEYRREVPPDPVWTRKAHELQLQRKITAKVLVRKDDRRLIASVVCPRCDGDFTVDRASTGVYVGGGSLSESTTPGRPAAGGADAPLVETITCGGSPVDGTPPGERGCGATFNVWARVEKVER